jgi:hypothetical protein
VKFALAVIAAFAVGLKTGDVLHTLKRIAFDPHIDWVDFLGQDRV